MKKIMTYKILAGVIGIGLSASTYFILDKKVKDRLALLILKQIQKSIASSSSGLSSSNAFDLHFLSKVLQKSNGQVIVLHKDTAKDYADAIHSSFKPWYRGGDDEAKVYSVFRSLKDKVQVSQVAIAYKESHHYNLIEVLKDRFSSAEIKTVLDIVNNLPDYTLSVI